MDNNNNAQNAFFPFPAQPNVYAPPLYNPYNGNAHVAQPVASNNPPAYRRLKTAEEIAREIEDAKVAQRLLEEERTSTSISMKQDEELAKRLMFEENSQQMEQRKLKELENETAALRIQQEIEKEETSRRRKVQEDEAIARQKREHGDLIRKIQQEEEEYARKERSKHEADVELALRIQREEENRIRETNDAAVARRFQEEENRAAEAERRRVAQQEETRRRIAEEERIREQERRRIEDERRSREQLVADAELAHRLDQQLNIYRPYVPPPPPVPSPSNAHVTPHTLNIHKRYCGCAKNNTWNVNHVSKIHRKYCNCGYPYVGEHTNEGLYHSHTAGCRLYCKYESHSHTAECCRKNHIHNNRCHCVAKFA